MKKLNISAILLMAISLNISFTAQSQEHPNLIMTKSGVEKIRQNLGKVPLFDASLESVKQEVDAEIALGIDTPIPKDFSGGYTHQRHKLNFIIAQKAGALYQILQDEKYAIYIKDMLFQYETMYKTLPVHPQERSYARGKLFWQCLNDSNWLVYMSQAYDAIYETLSKAERDKLENNLFRPFADFISIGNPKFYNRIHNHSTWGNAAVGMIALVMDDKELLDRALYGIEDDGLPIGGIDNDGGTIKVEGQKKGFLANLEDPFSPDGYYTEGPYYQRYAMYPFLIFALGMHNVKPEMKVFEHKDNVLLKGVDALLNLTDADGEFFPLNDGQKGMSYYTASLVTAVDVAYHYGSQNPQLLSIAEKQNKVLLNQAGLSVAMGIRDGKSTPYLKNSINLTDGQNGDQGGVSVLRYGNEDLTLVFKYAAQGLSHGHYDKLSFSLFEKGNEVIQDYGLARFVNIGQKGGGNYLPENTTWAKTTIAHNTLSQNQQMHFGGQYKVASQHHSELHVYDVSNKNVQVVSATETNAYPGTKLQRTMALIKNPSFEKAFLLDIMKIISGTKNQYEMPFYYMGQVLSQNFSYESPEVLKPLGTENGYQHLYLEGKGQAAANTSQFSWLGQGKYYTLSSATSTSDELLLTRIGANDPEFNLRRDAALMIRRKDTDNTSFVSVIEPHGSYSPVSELSLNSNSNIKQLLVMHDDANYTAVSIEDVKGASSLFIIANKNASADKQHTLPVAGKTYKWTGVYYFSE
ncbi:heparinase II/III family protein [Paraglaciecola aquimarina]|uniref:Heparinase II/III family protein n=1 Tax=Paraglaciecola algarum TaxID=3050085 RepID=A0ABS9D3N5_9ALTE|nr:alginate lyase family protein [Paraglaciecola sp. G1-23]MCF2947540.1 heparinase II/III family protein [Paraglaciecola sp. G1-23]